MAPKFEGLVEGDGFGGGWTGDAEGVFVDASESAVCFSLVRIRQALQQEAEMCCLGLDGAGAEGRPGVDEVCAGNVAEGGALQEFGDDEEGDVGIGHVDA